MRWSPRSLAAPAAACAVVAGLVLAGGCSSGGSGEPGADAPTTGAPLPRPGSSEVGDGAPTDAARAAVAGLGAAPAGVTDCGRHPEDAGWPTTIAPDLRMGECLLAAYRSGAPAVAVVTGRDQAGGARVAEYEVRGPGVLVITRHDVAPDGTVTTTEGECAPPDAALWLLGSDGSIGDGAAHVSCTA